MFCCDHFFGLLLVNLKVKAAIRWEALRLWLEGMRPVPRPNAAVPPDSETTLAAGKTPAYIIQLTVCGARTVLAKDGMGASCGLSPLTS